MAATTTCRLQPIVGSRGRSDRVMPPTAMRALLLALLLPSLLLSGRTSHRTMPMSNVIFSEARLSPRLGDMLGIPPLSGGGFSDAFHIRRGHSHNDYHQSNPLSSALRHGIKSVEVDVFPRNDQLWVGHTRFELDSTRTIDNLYIDPILSMMKRAGVATVDPRLTVDQNGRPFPQGRTLQRKGLKPSSTNQDGSNLGTQRRNQHLMNPEDNALTLLVDFKANPEKSVNLLHEAIAPLRPYLSKVDRNGKFRKGKVTVLVSGNRPKHESLSTEKGERFIFIDGRARDISMNTDSALVPMVSLSWRSLQLARLVGRGEKHMRRMVDSAHSQGKRLRIWGAPNREALWRQMVRSNVDLLSIDDHGKFARFASQLGFSR